ncbi:hypothetical protein [Streptomyces sp. NPDC051452]|uniref:hypothetical protein n=1 Tax=Streptomyces sp. NPDC051452 TaxID=3365654 RepID=UPI0037B31463
MLHLWPTDRTLARRLEDHRLSDDVPHHLAPQTQSRSAGAPVAVAATFPGGAATRHWAAPRPSYPHAVRVARADG